MSNFNEPVPLSMLGTPIRGIATLPSALQEPRPPDLCPCGKWKWRVRGPLLARVACKASSNSCVVPGVSDQEGELCLPPIWLLLTVWVESLESFFGAEGG